MTDTWSRSTKTVNVPVTPHWSRGCDVSAAAANAHLAKHTARESQAPQLPSWMAFPCADTPLSRTRLPIERTANKFGTPRQGGVTAYCWQMERCAGQAGGGEGHQGGEEDVRARRRRAGL